MRLNKKSIFALWNTHLHSSKLCFFGLRKPKTKSFYSISNKMGMANLLFSHPPPTILCL